MYGLHDISKVKSYDLAQLCINHLMNEIVKHHEKLLDNRVQIVQMAPEDQIGHDQMFVGGCLPLVVILYMDFLDLMVDVQALREKIVFQLLSNQYNRIKLPFVKDFLEKHGLDKFE